MLGNLPKVHPGCMRQSWDSNMDLPDSRHQAFPPDLPSLEKSTVSEGETPLLFRVIQLSFNRVGH